jgi:hypothetical protein
MHLRMNVGVGTSVRSVCWPSGLQKEFLVRMARNASRVIYFTRDGAKGAVIKMRGTFCMASRELNEQCRG